jgi:hypothetical protein
MPAPAEVIIRIFVLPNDIDRGKDGASLLNGGDELALSLVPTASLKIRGIWSSFPDQLAEPSDNAPTAQNIKSLRLCELSRVTDSQPPL